MCVCVETVCLWVIMNHTDCLVHAQIINGCLPVCNCIHVLAELAAYMMSRCNCRQVGLLLRPSLQKCTELCTCRCNVPAVQANTGILHPFFIGIDMLLHFHALPF